MIELYEQDRFELNRTSSKGNQLKWKKDGQWYKADYLGYEGFAEYLTSSMLRYSDLRQEEYVFYETVQISYKKQKFLGCRSTDFLPAGWQLITLERLFRNRFASSLYEGIYRIPEPEKRLEFLVSQTERLTGLTDFGAYMTKLLTVDALFLNEDRHTHNIAVLLAPDGRYHYCPIFDQGAALLSDTRMEHPMGGDIYELIAGTEAKTISIDFAEALEAAEKLYGQQMHFTFTPENVRQACEKELFYSKDVKERVLSILTETRRRYAYLFVEQINKV